MTGAPTSSPSPTARARRERLATARLYLIVEAEPGGRAPERLLRPALAGGVDVVQLRDKEADDATLLRAAERFRRVCREFGALFVVNDRPDLAVGCRADGVHVGQDDASVEDVRREVGDEMLIGVSTHRPAEVDRAIAASVSYFAVGPVHATPTKPGRPAVGLELVAYAAARAGERPFFAIGGIDPSNAASVVAAGARRLAVVRAVRDAADPRAVAAALRASLPEEGRA